MLEHFGRTYMRVPCKRIAYKGIDSRVFVINVRDDQRIKVEQICID